MERSVECKQVTGAEVVCVQVGLGDIKDIRKRSALTHSV